MIFICYSFLYFLFLAYFFKQIIYTLINKLTNFIIKDAVKVMSTNNLSSYAKNRYEQEIPDNDIASEIKKAFFSYCDMVAPPEFSEYVDKIGYCYIFVRNMAELLYKNKVPVPIFSVEPEELDEGIDKELIEAMCEDIEDFSVSWTDDDNAEINAKAMGLLKKAFPDAPLITNIMGIAVGLPDVDEDSEPDSETNMDPKTAAEVKRLNDELREYRIKQAVILQAYIKEVKRQNFPIDAKTLILNYFKEASRNPDLAWTNLTTYPAYFSPIQTDKMLKNGIKEKDIPAEAKKINKVIGDFMKNLKIK